MANALNGAAFPRRQATAAPAALIQFNFENNDVRLQDRNGEPWFVLADVCQALEIANPSRAASRLDDDEKHTLDTIEDRADAPTLHSMKGRAGRGPQSLNIINESGLYSLILTSRKSAAKRFKKWVTSQVLPAIRKTGGYQAAPVADDPRVDYLVKIIGQFAGNQKFVTEDRFDQLVATVNKMADAIVKIANDRDSKLDPEPHVTETPTRIARTQKDHWQDAVLEWADARVEPFRLMDMFSDLASEHRESKDMSRRARELRIARILRAHGYDKRGMKPKGRMNSVYWEKVDA